MTGRTPDAATPRTYADHVRDWEAARAAIIEARGLLVPDEYGAVSFSALAVYFHKYGSTLLDAVEALLDATAFENVEALHRQTMIAQRIGEAHV